MAMAIYSLNCFFNLASLSEYTHHLLEWALLTNISFGQPPSNPLQTPAYFVKVSAWWKNVLKHWWQEIHLSLLSARDGRDDLVAAARELATQASTGQLVITFFMLGQSSELQLSKSLEMRGCILWWDTSVFCFSSFVERKYLKGRLHCEFWR